MTAPTLAARCAAALLESDPIAKARTAGRAARDFARETLALGTMQAPERPARPPRPVLLPPRDMPKRGAGSREGRVALLHALAHIELNAVDLALDIVVRFGGEDGPLAPGERAGFARGWLRVARDEAKHFLLLARRLRQLGSDYGALPAHDGLWSAAHRTRHDLLARLAVVPLVHEAHGLDVQPVMKARLEAAGDRRSADILALIARDEISHVRTGYFWFTRLCAARGLDPPSHYRALVARYHGRRAGAPFNAQARAAAGLPPGFYQF